MNRFGRPFRLLALLLAVMQIMAPAVVSVIDGDLAAHSQPTVAHIEALGGNDCAPVHSPECSLCQLINASATVGEAFRPVPVETAHTQCFRSTVLAYASFTSHGYRSRAPPDVHG